MRRLSIATVILLAACGSAFPQKPAQTIPSKKEMSELIYQGFQKRRLTEKDSAPFHLVASIRYVYGGATANGTYELLWADPDRFREEFRLGDLFETDVALDGKRYVVRNAKLVPYPLWWVRSEMTLPVIPQGAGHGSKPSVRSIQQTSPNMLQVDLGTKPGTFTVQIDATGKQIVSETTNIDEKNVNVSSLRDDFVDFASAHYPKHILSTVREETVEVTISKLEVADSFADTVFVPPSGAAAQDWCAEPAVGNAPQPNINQMLAFLPLYRAKETIDDGAQYILVGTDGRVKELDRLYPNGSAKEFRLDGAIKSSQIFPVLKCGGKPIEHEVIMQAYIISR